MSEKKCDQGFNQGKKSLLITLSWCELMMKIFMWNQLPWKWTEEDADAWFHDILPQEQSLRKNPPNL